MKLKSIPFNLIKNKSKIIEVRLNDEKRRRLNIGDKIVFSELPDLQNKITTKVINLLKYETFNELFSSYPASSFGGEGWSVQELVENMHEYYSVEEEQQLGVLGIEIEVID